MGFWIAWQFLTIFPGPATKDAGITTLGRSLTFFPVVGLVLGAALLGLDQLFELFLPRYLIDALLVTAIIIMTGALHLDGFMDTCDGFAVKSSARDRLTVMADSHVGGFGVAGACCLILLKFTAILSLTEELRPVGLLLAPSLARWGVAYAIIAFPSAREGGLGNLFKQNTSWLMIPIMTVFTLAVAVALIHWMGAVLLISLLITTYLLACGFKSRLGGLTGDTYGAIIEIGETAAFIGIVIMGEAGGSSWLDLSW